MIQRMIGSFVGALLAAGTAVYGSEDEPLPTVDHVDLHRYMGDWFPIASIPPSVEKDAHDAVETYRLDEDGDIPTRFVFRKGRPDGPEKVIKSKAFVRPSSGNAVWDVQFIWPIKAEYRIAWLAQDYSQVIVARSKRDYVWYMARTPQVPESDYTAAVDRIRGMGYDVAKLRRMPRRAIGDAGEP